MSKVTEEKVGELEMYNTKVTVAVRTGTIGNSPVCIYQPSRYDSAACIDDGYRLKRGLHSDAFSQRALRRSTFRETICGSRTTSCRATTYSSEQMAIISMEPIISSKAEHYEGSMCVNLNPIKTDQMISLMHYYNGIIGRGYRDYNCKMTY